MKTRLVFRIYAVVLASLLLFAVATGALLRTLDARNNEFRGQDMAAQLVLNALPPSDASTSEQQAALQKITDRLDVDVTLLDARGQIIARVGRPLEQIKGQARDSIGRLVLPDGRMALAHWQKAPWGERRYFGWAIAGALLGLLLIVALLSYPVVSRLTRRLETLRHAVKEWGDGDLSRRVNVKGHDEVAQLAHSFNQAAERIEALLQAHKMLLANVSHELRTPLTRMRLNLEMLDNDLVSTQAQQRKNDMTCDLNELNQMIEGVLVSSRLDAQEHLDIVQSVDLLALSTGEAVYYEGVTVSGEVAIVQGDPQLLRRLLRNLLDNALKYGAPPVEVGVHQLPNGTIEWRIRDHGQGVLLDQPNDLFVPFVRAHSGSTQGTGLGLGMVQKIAQLHGGHARIISARAEPMQVLILFSVA